MKNFRVTIKDFSDDVQVVSRSNIEAINIVDAVKKLRATSKWCYDDETLVQWINSEDEWNVPIDNDFLLDLIEHEKPGVYYAMLAEEMEFKFVEVKK